MATSKIFISIFLYVVSLQIVNAQNCYEKFDPKYWNHKLKVKITGDFPECDSCVLSVVDKNTEVINNQFQVINFSIDYFQFKKYLFSSPHYSANFNEFDKSKLKDLFQGDFIRIKDIYVSCKRCKEECIVVLPSIFLEITSKNK